MKSLLKHIEIEYLKSLSYEEINNLFHQLKDKIIALEVKKHPTEEDMLKEMDLKSSDPHNVDLFHDSGRVHHYRKGFKQCFEWITKNQFFN